MTQNNIQLFALSQPQQRIWYTELVYPSRNTSTIIATVKIMGTVRIDALQQAINRVIAQNDSFRIKITVRDGVPYQYVEPFAAQSIEALQFTQEEAELWVSYHNAQPFPLLDSQLYRFVILQLGEEDTWISFKMHHIISDGFTMEKAINEITRNYMNIVHDTDSDTPPPANSYLDFIQTEQSYEQSERYHKDKKYWTEKFTDLPEVTGLKSYNPLTVNTAARREIYTLEHELYRGVTAFCEAHNISIFTFFLAALYIYLHKTTGEQDLTVGTLYANRTLKKEKNTMGMFVSTVATRLRVEPESELLTFLQGVGREQASILRHQRYPYNKVIQDLREQQSSTDIRRLFGVTIQYRTLSFSRFDEAVQQVDADFCGDTVNDFDIAMIDMLDDDKLILQLDYRIELFSEQEIARIIQQFLNVADHMVKGPQKQIQELSLMSDEERAQIVNVFNATAAPYPQDVGIHELFEEQVERIPDQIAVMFGNQRLTYRELNERANSLARVLQLHGVGPDKLVGLMVQRSVEMVVGLLAVLKAGGAYVPIDPEFPSTRIKYMLEDSDVTVLLTSRDLAEEHQCNANTLFLEDAELYQGESGNLGAIARPEHLAYVIYTSGTTGKPKGVMVEHHSVLNRILWMHNRYGLSSEDTILQKTTFTFDVSVWELFWWSMVGSKVSLLSVGGEKNPEEIVDTIARDGVTTMHFVPAMLNAFLEYVEQQPREVMQAKLGTLRHVFASGEALPPQHAARFQQLVSSLGGAKLINLYGPTEATVDVTYFDCEPEEEYAVIPIGKPIQNIRLYIVQEGTEQLQPIGVIGELCIGGVGVARGYLNRAELTAEKFVADPFAGGEAGYERMYRTGDLARWMPDGKIEYLGRIDHQVKIRGYRIELDEVESHLLKVESVREAVVMAHADETGQKHMVAYYVAGQELGASELRSELGRELPSYMVPSYFIQLEQMPLSPNGKIDRKALPAPEGSLQSRADYAEPRTAPERAMVAVWQAVLGVQTVGILDNFFDLGGDSIKAIQIASRVFQTGYKLDMKNLFRFPTIAGLAPHMHEVSRVAEQGEVSGETALLPIQHWFFAQERERPQHFNQAVMLYHATGFDETVVRQAMDHIVKHHDALRTVFHPGASGYSAWTRRVEEGALYTLETVDYRERATYAEALEAKATEIQSSIDLSAGPLVKLGLFRTTGGDHLLIAIHHLVMDGVSWRILFEDFATGYEQAMKGEPVRLPYKTDSFQTWARELTAYTQRSAAASDASYWEQVEQVKSMIAPLPKDFVYEGSLNADSEVLMVEWSEDVTRQLLKQAHRAYNTEVNDLLLTALGLALHNWTGAGKVLVNLEGHGREAILPEVDITRTIGWFTSLYPVQLETGKGMTLAQRIKETKEGLRRIPHKGLTYGTWRYLSHASASNEARMIAAEPEVSFNYLGQIDQDLQYSGITLSSYSVGEADDAHSPLQYTLDLNAIISKGKLRLTIAYSRMQYRKETLERVAGLLQSALQEVIAHCVAQEQPELTPSDVSFKGLTIGELEQIAELAALTGELENVYPLSPMQKGMLFYNLMDSQSGAYFEQASFALQGHFNIAAFAESLDILVQRHTALRTNFYSGWKDEPLQVVYRNKRSELYVEDLRDMKEVKQYDYILDFTRKDKQRGFDLAQDALMRVAIFCTGEDSYRFVWSFHHIVMDGWCLSLMTGEVFASYFAILAHQQPQLAPVTPYSQYIEWLEQQDRQAAAGYWSKVLEGYEEQSHLPQIKIQGKTGYQAERLDFDLGAKLTADIQRVAKRYQVTINTLMQTVWGILLQKYNGTDDVVFGSVVSGRPAEIPNVEHIIGLFINTIPVRISTQEGSLFSDVMKQTQEQSIASHAYDTYPLYEIQGLSELKQDLINHILVFENYPVDEQIEQLGNGKPSGFSITGVESVEQTNYDFNLMVLPENTIRMSFGYNALAFERESVEQIRDHLVQLLKQVGANPDIRVHELDMVTAQEREQIVEVWGNTAATYPSGQTIHDLFEVQAARTPEQVALFFEGERLSYQELNERANRLARTLRSQGVTKDHLVGLIAERSVDMIVGILGILKAGGAYVPIDPTYPEERIRYMLNDSGAELLLTQSYLMEKAVFDGHVLVLDGAQTVYHEDGSNLEPLSGPNDLAYVIYTSGTTGQPKGVMVEHRNVVRLVKNTNYAQLDADTRILQTGAVVFDASIFEIWGALLNGGQLVLVSQDVILDAPKLKEAVRSHGITTMWLTAPLFNQLSQQDLELFEGIRELLVGGDVLSVPHINRVMKAHPHLQIINGYGPTENTTFSTTHAITGMQSESVPIGRPIHNSTVYVVDRSMQLQPVGAWGELIVGGDGVARGYRNRPDLTAEKFIDSPFRSGERCYRTGDLVRWNADGTLEYKGRIDAQVKIRGYRIELGEVEAQLLKLEAVREAVVIAREDEQGQKQLCAYVVTHTKVAANELRSALSQELPGYMVPSYFVQLEKLPLTPNGKVDRRALPQPEGSVDSGEDYVAARTEVERTLVSVWKSVLGIEQIGVLDNFFYLGGDSIKAIQVSSRLLQNGYKLEMRELFQYPTIAELNGRVQQVSRVSDQGEVTGTVALTPIQHWFIEQQPSKPGHYNQALMLHREDRMDETALRQALQRIVEHHDALRIVFRQNADGGFEAWNRGVQEGELYSLEVVDFTNEPNFTHALEAKASEIQGSICLDEGPLVKLGLFRCPDGDHLLVAIHHLVVDGVSWRILLEDLATGYEQALRGESVRLPNKTDSFRLWARQLSAYASSTALEKERSYWQQLEQAGAAQAALPKDYTRKSETKHQLRDDRTLTVAWTAEETEQFLKQAHRAYNTEANDLLLTALGTAIHEWAGISQVLVNLEGHGREAILPDMDITRTVGWFTSQFPVVLDMGEDRNVGRRIKNLKEGLRRLPHKGIGYGILRYLAAAREGEPSFVAEPEISFNYLGQFDQDLKNNAFRMSPYSIGASVSDTLTKRYALDIHGMITEGALELTISYSSKTFMKKSIKKLANLLQESLRQVLAHCVEKELPELTPSDLSFQGLTAGELEHIVEQTSAAGELENIYSLTPMQKGILFHGLMEPQSGAYFEQATFDLQGSFQVDAFAESLNLLVDRHQIFRTNFYSGWNEQPLQVVYRHKAVRLRFEDMRSMEPEELNAYIADFAERDKAEGFDFSSGELMRVSILRTDEESYRFVWSFHHILMDGWCLFLVVGEAFQTYFALLEGRNPELTPVTPYSEYIEWLERQDNSEAERFWSSYFAGFEQQTVLPQAKQVDDHAKGYEADKLSFTLSREVTEQMNRLVKQQQVTVNTLLQAAWGVVLQRYNHSRDVVFGSVVSGRSADIPGVDKMIGLFINTVPVRIHSGKDVTFARLMKQTQEQALASRAYETYPLYEIQALTEQKQDLVNHIIVFENYPVEQRMEQMGSRDTNGFAIANASMSEQTNYDFNITIVPGDEIGIHLEYNALVFERAAVEQIREHLLHIIEEAINRPDALVDELELVTAEEKAKIIDGFGSVGVSAWSDAKEAELLFHVYVEEQAQLIPDHVAVVYEEQQLTYRELNERANQLARRLRDEGIGRESIVGILSERSVDMLVGILAVWKAGGAYVPLDADYPSERIRFMLEDSGATVLLTQTGLQGGAQVWLEESQWALAGAKSEGQLETAVSAETLEQDMDTLSGDLSPLKLASSPDSEAVSESAMGLRLHTVLALDDESLYTGDTTDIEHINEPQDLAYVIYTSGTTGRPKGVMIEHRSLVNTAAAYRRDYRLSQFPVRLLQLASFSFDVFVGDIARVLYNGGTMVICSKDDRIDPSRLYGWIRDYQITVFESTPALIVPFMQHVHEHGLDMSSLELLITSSDSCSVTDYRVLQERFGADIRIINSYGVTEAAIDSSFYDEELSKLPGSGNVPIGQAWLNARFYIVDSQLNPVPVGVLGELCIGGAGVARGYLNRADLTAEKFVANPYVLGERLYRTGDLARWMPDGNVDFIGRMDYQVKIRGFRIELGEIETAIQRVPGVRQAVVIDRTDERGHKYLCGYLTGEAELQIEEVRAELKAGLPAHMVPAQLMRLETIPLTSNGKIDRKALPEPEGSIHTGAAYVAPRTTVEQVLATVWAGVLGVEAVGTQDNFFELGGDSIKALQVSSRLLQAGYRLEMKDLFSKPTVASLSPLLRTDGNIASQEDAVGKVELTPIQRWFFEQQPVDLHHSNQAMMLYRAGRFDVDALRRTMERIIQHHDALRTVFRTTEHGYAAWNRSVEEGELYALDIVNFSGVEDESAAVEAKASEIQASIWLSEGPLVKLGLFQCAQGDHLLIVIHHLVVDGVSWRILLEDLSSGYEQAVAGKTGKAIQLPHKTDSFQTWAERLSAYANSEMMERELAYWQHIEQVEASLAKPLPKDYANDKALLGDSEVVTVRWTKQETDLLLKQAHRPYNTEMNDLLLAALGKAVYEWSGSKRVLINLEGHGREAILTEVDITRTIGWFTSQFPVVLDGSLGQGGNTARLIKQVKEGLRNIPQKGIGYGILRYLSNADAFVQAGVKLQTEPEISFNYLGQFDQDYKGNDLQPSYYSIGVPVSTNAAMDFALDINGVVVDGELIFTIRYGTTQFRHETIARLGELLAVGLREVISHCVAQERAELTPSDVLLNNITLDELEQLVEDTRDMGELENVYALTPMQKGMLFYSLMDEDSAAYFEQATFELNGHFDVVAFGKSFDLLVQRHEALRTNFISSWKDEPVQVVFRNRRGRLYYEDLRGLEKEARKGYVEAFILADKAKGFCLAEDVLIRVSILQTGDETYHFIWSFHHILMDGWCLSFMTQEVFGSYLALRAGKKPVLEPVTPFSRFIEWLERQDREASLQYWSGYLADYEQQITLPQQKTQPKSIQSGEYVGGELEYDFQPELVAQIDRVAKQNQVTINTLIQTVWGVLLQKYNNSTDVVFGSVVSGRPGDIPGVERMIGLFINTIPVRVQSEEGEAFVELMKRTQRQALVSNAYDAFPLYEIQALTEQKQDLINHIMIFENYPVEQQVEQLGSEGQEPFTISNVVATEQTNYDLNVVVMPGEGIKIRFMYNELNFDQTGIERLHGHFARLLEQISLNPHARIEELELVTVAEKQQITVAFNDNVCAYPWNQTIHQMFEDQVECTPDQVALVFGNQSLTYRELNERVNRLARTLRSEGVKPDQSVGILVQRSLEMIVGIYAILKAGGAYVPIDPEYPVDRIRFMLEDSGVKLVLTQASWVEQALQSFEGKVLVLDREDIYHEDGSNLEPLAGPHHVAYVIYTSGSTGKPKGVMVEHHSVINRILWMHDRYGLGAEDTILQKTTFTFDVSVWELFWWSIVGSKVSLLPVGGEKDPEEIADTIARDGVSTMHFVPAMLHAFLDYVDRQPREVMQAKLGTLRHVFASGEALPPQHVVRFQRLISNIAEAKLTNLYGPTEATVDVSYFDCDPTEEFSVIPIGKPIQNIRLYIVKEGTEQLQPVGIAGELCIAGVGLARGYLNRPALTAEKFVPNPWSTGERMYRTGDLARWLPDGNIEYLGRLDHQVKIRGYRVELGEIEDQLLKLSVVREATVIARENGMGSQELCAYVVTDMDEPQFTAINFREALSKKLPSYMLPSSYVQLERMPLSANGKIDRKALPAPDIGDLARAEYVAPRTVTEEKLVEIWEQVLGIPQVGITDNFFEIGGHSLRAMIMLGNIQKKLKVKLSIRETFKFPTIEQLSQLISGMEPKEYMSIPFVEPQDFYILSSAQMRLYILNQLDGGEVAYNMPIIMWIEGPINVSRFEEAFSKLIQRHESLRTSFIKVNGTPVQKIHDEVTFEIDYCQAEESEIPTYLNEFFQPFDLTKAPLLRVKLVQVSFERYLFLFDMHHIISDGVSTEILLRELTLLYNGKELKPLRIQYKDYAVWQQSELQNEALNKQQRYWLELLQEEIPKLQLPTNFARPKIRTFKGNVMNFIIDKTVSKQLENMVFKGDYTLYMLLLSAYIVLLHKYSGQEDIIVGTPVAGRTHPDLDSLIGMFVNTIVIRNQPEKDKKFSQLLKEVKESTLQAYENQDYPLDAMIEKLGISSDLSRNLLFDTTFALQHNSDQQFNMQSLTFTPYDYDLKYAKFDISLLMNIKNDQLYGSFEYSTELFKESMINKFVHDFKNILFQLCENTDIVLSDISLDQHASDNHEFLEELFDFNL
ncbi:non-ribosomal peptide synthase/polyketide synthase [Paenibacillus sp. S33]